MGIQEVVEHSGRSTSIALHPLSTFSCTVVLLPTQLCRKMQPDYSVKCRCRVGGQVDNAQGITVKATHRCTSSAAPLFSGSVGVPEIIKLWYILTIYHHYIRLKYSLTSLKVSVMSPSFLQAIQSKFF